MLQMLRPSYQKMPKFIKGESFLAMMTTTKMRTMQAKSTVMTMRVRSTQITRERNTAIMLKRVKLSQGQKITLIMKVRNTQTTREKNTQTMREKNTQSMREKKVILITRMEMESMSTPSRL